MTYEQQLTEELHALSELLNVMTAEQISSVPRVREVFRYLNRRKGKCEQAIRAFNYKPVVKRG